jgi:hypothetical protein
LVKNSSRTAATNHPAEHGIEFDVVMARLCCAYVFVPHCGTSTRPVGAASRIHSNAKIKAVLPPPFPAKRLSRISNKHALAIVFLVCEKGASQFLDKRKHCVPKGSRLGGKNSPAFERGFDGIATSPAGTPGTGASFQPSRWNSMFFQPVPALKRRAIFACSFGTGRLLKN